MIHPLLSLVGYSELSVQRAEAVRLLNALATRGFVYHDMGETEGRR